MTKRDDDDTNDAKANDAPPKEPVISRRRLVYAAPAILVSRSLGYRQSGCGKDQPTTYNCMKAPQGS